MLTLYDIDEISIGFLDVCGALQLNYLQLDSVSIASFTNKVQVFFFFRLQQIWNLMMYSNQIQQKIYTNLRLPILNSCEA